MKINIILAGVGGQGILSIAAILDTAALQKNLYVKQSEVHGMSQRGGAVESHVRISDKPIFSDLIPSGKADLIIALEPMELLRYLPFLKKEGWLVSDSNPFDNIAHYPDLKGVLSEIETHKNHIILDALNTAKKIGNSKAANMVLLGASIGILPFTEAVVLAAIKKLFSKKGERIIKLNTAAFLKGVEYSKK
ncbi:MAG: indolepyruvate oxidoreductase subunit beta [Flavobacteriaceae bacterium]|nr:indolepyruvate oxidoreductase subunit beta [Flavobacteriaceae bacterium]